VATTAATTATMTAAVVAAKATVMATAAASGRHGESPSVVLANQENAEHALNSITPQRLCSAFSVLQLGYEPKKNGEQNAERMRRTLDNWDPKGINKAS
jgi:hypothetical protein